MCDNPGQPAKRPEEGAVEHRVVTIMAHGSGESSYPTISEARKIFTATVALATEQRLNSPYRFVALYMYDGTLVDAWVHGPCFHQEDGVYGLRLL
jgi:hypothetical protein